MLPFKIDITKITETKTKIKINLPKENVEKYFDETALEIQKQKEIPGFRKGFVPLEIIKKKFSEEIKTEVIKRIINQTLFEAIEKNKIKFIEDTIKIENFIFEPNGSFTYEVTLEVEPEVKLKSYKGLKLKKEIRNVTKKDIEKAIEQLKEYNAKILPSLKNSIEQQDILPNSNIFCVINYKVFIDGKELKKFEGKNILIDLSQDNFPKGFKEGLVGLSKNEKKTIDVEFPVNFPETELMGKNAKIEVELLEIKQKQYPNIDDNFAKDLGYDSIEHLLKEIEIKIKNEFEKEAKNKLKNQIYEILLKEHNFHLPETEVQRHYENIIDAIRKDFIYRGGKEENFNLSEEQKKSLLKKAEEEVKLKYILKKIIEEEKIQLTKEILDKEKGKLIAMNPQRAKEIEEYFEKNIDLIASNILEEKIFDLIVSQAKIKEVDITPK